MSNPLDHGRRGQLRYALASKCSARPASQIGGTSETGPMTITMIYLKWTRSELATLDMDALYTEVDDDGWVQREVGISASGLVIHHLVPTTGRPGWFGLARLSSLMLNSNVSKHEFETYWDAGSAGRPAF